LRKLNANLSKVALMESLKKVGSRRPPRSPLSIPDYMYAIFLVQEITILLNLP